MTALLLTAVMSTRRKTSIALTANHLIAVVGLSEGSEGRLDDTTSHLEEDFKSSLFSNRIRTNGLIILKFLSGENQTLIVVINVFLLLDHLLDVFHSFSRLNLKRDSVSLKRR